MVIHALIACLRVLACFSTLLVLTPYRALDTCDVIDCQAYDAEATPSYGTDTLEAFFAKALKEGLKGQELGDQAVFGVGE